MENDIRKSAAYHCHGDQARGRTQGTAREISKASLSPLPPIPRGIEIGLASEAEVSHSDHAGWLKDLSKKKYNYWESEADRDS